MFGDNFKIRYMEFWFSLLFGLFFLISLIGFLFILSQIRRVDRSIEGMFDRWHDVYNDLSDVRDNLEFLERDIDSLRKKVDDISEGGVTNLEKLKNKIL